MCRCFQKWANLLLFSFFFIYLPNAHTNILTCIYIYIFQHSNKLPNALAHVPALSLSLFLSLCISCCFPSTNTPFSCLEDLYWNCFEERFCYDESIGKPQFTCIYVATPRSAHVRSLSRFGSVSVDNSWGTVTGVCLPTWKDIVS